MRGGLADLLASKMVAQGRYGWEDTHDQVPNHMYSAIASIAQGMAI